MKLFRKRLVMLLILIGICLLIPAVWSASAKDREAAAAKAESERQLAALESQQATLSAEVAQLKTPEGMEAALRQRYGVGHEGEGVIYIETPDDATQTPTTTPRRGFFGWVQGVWPF